MASVTHGFPAGYGVHSSIPVRRVKSPKELHTVHIIHWDPIMDLVLLESRSGDLFESAPGIIHPVEAQHYIMGEF